MGEKNLTWGERDFFLPVAKLIVAFQKMFLYNINMDAQHTFITDDQARVRPWDPTKALEALVAEQAVYDGENHVQRTRRLLEEAAPEAALSLVHLASHAVNEAVRLRAANSVVKAVIEFNAEGDDDGPLAALVRELREITAE